MCLRKLKLIINTIFTSQFTKITLFTTVGNYGKFNYTVYTHKHRNSERNDIDKI